MLSMVTCLRSRAVSRNWDHHVWLLQRTLDSMLAQTHPDFRIVVVCHEIPDIPQLKHPKVNALSVAFSPPLRNNDEMCADKVLKLTAGAEWALQRGTDYVMFADGDDLVSNRIASFVAERPGANGWFSNSEYFFRYGGKVLRRNDMVPGRSGPTVIVHGKALRFADALDSSELWHRVVSAGENERFVEALASRGLKVNTLAAVGHTKYVNFLDSIGSPIEALPFVASIVILHPDSTSNVPGGKGSSCDFSPPRHPLWRRKLSRLMQVVRQLPTLRVLNLGLRAEFSVPGDGDLPAEFRVGGIPL